MTNMKLKSTVWRMLAILMLVLFWGGECLC